MSQAERPLPRSARGLGLRPDLWPLALRAVGALVLARRRLRTIRPAELARGTPPADPLPAGHPDPAAARIGWLVPRIAARMPFRADCLVQALAAQRLLARHGLEGRIHVGARKTAAGFEAHAWLTLGDRVVTGGEISGYSRLIGARV